VNKRNILYSLILAIGIIITLLMSQMVNVQLFSISQVSANSSQNTTQKEKINQTQYNSSQISNPNIKKFNLILSEDDNIYKFSTYIIYYLVVVYIIDSSHPNKTIATLILTRGHTYLISLFEGDYIILANLEISTPASNNIPIDPKSQYLILLNIRFPVAKLSLHADSQLKIIFNVTNLPVLSTDWYASIHNLNSNIINVSKFYSITYSNPILFMNNSGYNFITSLFYVDNIIVSVSNNVITSLNYARINYDQLLYSTGVNINLNYTNKVNILAIYYKSVFIVSG